MSNRMFAVMLVSALILAGGVFTYVIVSQPSAYEQQQEAERQEIEAERAAAAEAAEAEAAAQEAEQARIARQEAREETMEVSDRITRFEQFWNEQTADRKNLLCILDYSSDPDAPHFMLREEGYGAGEISVIVTGLESACYNS